MANIDRKIKALELAVDYVPAQDDNHSLSIIIDMLQELKDQKQQDDTASGQKQALYDLIGAAYGISEHSSFVQIDAARESLNEARGMYNTLTNLGLLNNQEKEITGEQIKRTVEKINYIRDAKHKQAWKR
jgi:hypothetical protein